MAILRRFISVRPGFAAFLVAAALLLRVLVPAGFMPNISHGKVEISLCTGYGPAKVMAAMPGMGGKSDRPQHRGGEMPCAFAGLAMPGLAGADPIQLAAAIAIITATSLFLVALLVARHEPRLRPPLRGPPLAV
jgi:hypothetical protein